MPRPILIAGSGGMLGHALCQVCTTTGRTFVAPSEDGLDITSADEVDRAVSEFAAANPDGALVNAAAYTNVERAEEEATRAFAVNERGAELLARAAAREGLRFVHVSTDFVFDGLNPEAYTENDAPNPRSVYGRSKLAGEIAVASAHGNPLTVRTAWVFGPDGVNFVTKILDQARSAHSVKVVNDEFGSPTYTIDLATGILGLMDADAQGMFHLAGGGSCSRDTLARAILQLAGRDDVEVVPVPASTFQSKAQRPPNSALDCSKAAALGVVMPDWRDALARFIASARRGGSA